MWYGAYRFGGVGHTVLEVNGGVGERRKVKGWNGWRQRGCIEKSGRKERVMVEDRCD